MSQGLSGENAGNCAAVYYCIQDQNLDIYGQMTYVRQAMADHPDLQWIGAYCDVCPETGKAPHTALMRLCHDAKSGLFQILVAPSGTVLSPDILQELKQHGVTVYISDTNRQPINPWIKALRELMYTQ